MRTRFLSMLAAYALAGAAAAQSTVFTYQGRLKSGAAPAAGLHDFRFTLFNVPSGGVPVGATQCADNVTVSGGLFTTPIDFGPQFATPDPRFLEIEVRADSGLGCATATGFVVLTPRQPLTAAPIANHARTAFSLAAADGSPANAVFVDNTGNVGIGTGAPIYPVHIASPEPALALQDSNSSTQQVGYVDYRDSANVSRGWVGFGLAGDPDFSVINARAAGDIVLNTLGGGNVGIGTAAPAAKLEVNGDIKMAPQTRYLALHGSAFMPTSVGPFWSPDEPSAYYTSGGGMLADAAASQPYVAPVQLPQGAVVTELRAYYLNDHPTGQVTVELVRSPLNGAPAAVVMASVSSGGGTSTWASMQTNIIANATLNNASNSYCVAAYMVGSLTAVQSLKGVRIEYTVTNPAP